MLTRSEVLKHVTGRYGFQRPAIVHEDNQGASFLANNRQVGIHTKHINIHHQFLKDMVEEKYVDIKYISREENPAVIMTNNCSEADHAKHAKRITEGELWEIVETGRKNVNNNRVMDGFTDCDLTEYSSRALANPVDQTNVNERVSVKNTAMVIKGGESDKINTEDK